MGNRNCKTQFINFNLDFTIELERGIWAELTILGGNMQRIYIFGWFGREASSIGGIHRVVGFTEGLFRQCGRLSFSDLIYKFPTSVKQQPQPLFLPLSINTFLSFGLVLLLRQQKKNHGEDDQVSETCLCTPPLNSSPPPPPPRRSLQPPLPSILAHTILAHTSILTFDGSDLVLHSSDPSNVRSFSNVTLHHH
ncbi:hypothetical protein YC2023_115686 [Brassica napus]